MSKLLDAITSFAQGRLCFALGLFCALAGAGLATGIMAYEAIANDMKFTTESWVVIAPLWLGVGVLWWTTTRWPLLGALPFGALTLYTGDYFNDVYGQYMAGILLLLGAAVVLAAATDVETGPGLDVLASDS